MTLTAGRTGVIQVLACVVFCLVAAAEVIDTQASLRTHRLRRDRRASSFVRIGKSKTPSATEPDAFTADEENFAEKRASSFVRIGKAMSGVSEDPSFDFETDSRPFKRASSFVRIGRMHGQSGRLDSNRKRQSSFVRIGKSVPYESADASEQEDETKLMDYPQGNEVPDQSSIFVAKDD